ncbi:MAG: T9SS type A sorting domain-containing protein [Caldithrix sp.]|nr:T9SS type A sorting domain-containing protein [Caldithrix sp.]
MILKRYLVLSIIFVTIFHFLGLQQASGVNLDELQSNANHPQLISIALVANSEGSLEPHFIYKGTVSQSSRELLAHPDQFINHIDGNSLSSVSPQDSGRFYVSQTFDLDISQMLSSMENINSAYYEIRFAEDDAGLALDYFNTKGIFQVPFTAWDLNGTPDIKSDDIQLLVLINSVDGDSTWGIKGNHPAGWESNPAQESDAIYLYYPKESYAEFEQAYRVQVQTDKIDEQVFDDQFGKNILKRITINSLDIDPLNYINALNGYARPNRGTVIRWHFNVNLDIEEEPLYGLANEPFSYPLKISGFPEPDVMLVDAPEGMILNNNNEIIWQPDDGQVGGYEIVIRASNVNQTLQDTFPLWIDAVGWQHSAIKNNNLEMDIFNNGLIGKSKNGTGAGITYKSRQALAYGQLLIACGQKTVSGNPHENEAVHEFATLDGFSGESSPFIGFDTAMVTQFTDDRANPPLELRVRLKVHTSFDSEFKDIILLQYQLHNASDENLSDIYTGLLLNWNIGTNNNDYVLHDEEHNLLYMYGEQGENDYYYGAALYAYSLASIAAFESGITFDDDTMAELMTINTELPSLSNDYTNLLSTGPLTIHSGQSKSVTFIITAGDDQSDIRSKTAKAQSTVINSSPTIRRQIEDLVLFANSAPFNMELAGNNPVFFDPDNQSLIYHVQSSQPNIVATSINGSALTLQALSEGTAVVSISCEDEAGASTQLQFEVQVYPAYPESYQLNYTLTYPSRDDPGLFKTSEYKLVGFPGKSDLYLSELMTGHPEKDWIAFWDNGNPDNYYIGFEENDVFKLHTGRGFWLLANGNLNIDHKVSTSAITPELHVDIALHEGWNIISNPFNTSVNWQHIETYNQIDEPIFAYNSGSWKLADYIKPYHAYYFDNSNPSLAKLKIPYEAQFVKPVDNPSSATWQMSICLCEGSVITDSSLVIGVNNNALATIDPFDARKPRMLSGQPTIYLEAAKNVDELSKLARDIRAPVDSLTQWNLILNSAGNSQPILKLNQVQSIPANYQIFLTDAGGNFYIDLRKQSKINLPPDQNSHRFYLLVGKSTSMDQKLQSLISKKFIVEPNYPNPFNPQTTIPVQVPERMYVATTVYNALGKHIKTLHRGSLQAGKHFMQWYGKDQAGQAVSSGIYIVVIQTDQGYRSTHKMILLR